MLGWLCFDVRTHYFSEIWLHLLLPLCCRACESSECKYCMYYVMLALDVPACNSQKVTLESQ
jgi:hypothetical protein